jgi:hypothetical protein
MVEHVQLVFNCDAGTFKIRDSAYHVAVLHVTCRVVITANHKNPGMTPLGGMNKEVKHAEIFVITRQEHEGLLHGVQQVLRVVGTAESDARRDDCLMTGLPQQGGQNGLGAVVVKVKIHGSGA